MHALTNMTNETVYNTHDHENSLIMYHVVTQSANLNNDTKHNSKNNATNIPRIRLLPNSMYATSMEPAKPFYRTNNNFQSTWIDNIDPMRLEQPVTQFPTQPTETEKPSHTLYWKNGIKFPMTRCTASYNSFSPHPLSPNDSYDPKIDPEALSDTSCGFDEILTLIDMHKLIKIAQDARDGVKCRIIKGIEGGFNALFELHFDDGINWFARFPFLTIGVHIDDILKSEVATYLYLKNFSSIPVPDVYKYGLLGDISNEMTLPYMMLEKLPGRNPIDRLEEITTRVELEVEPQSRKEKKANRARATKLHTQIVDIMLELGMAFRSTRTYIEAAGTNDETHQHPFDLNKLET